MKFAKSLSKLDNVPVSKLDNVPVSKDGTINPGVTKSAPDGNLGATPGGTKGASQSAPGSELSKNAPRGNQGAPIESLLRGNMKQTTGSGFSTAQKGALGEARTALTMRRAGFDELPARLPGNQGFDGVWAKRGSNGSIIDLVITESKYASSGKLRLTNTATMGRQMSPQWIDANIQRMLNSTDPSVVRSGMLLQANRNMVRGKAAVLNPQGVQRFSNP